jgi:hypothetical protein
VGAAATASYAREMPTTATTASHTGEMPTTAAAATTASYASGMSTTASATMTATAATTTSAAFIGLRICGAGKGCRQHNNDADFGSGNVESGHGILHSARRNRP